ncbi:MAG TPA: 5-oxoprolinase subunit PxpB, partial [Gemmatimonadaceae bacterium]
LGDSAVTITLASSIDESAHRRIRAALRHIEAERPTWVVDVIPAFTSIAVHYDPVQVFSQGRDEPSERGTYATVVAALERILTNVSDEPTGETRVVEIPVSYGGDFGPDLDDVAQQHGLTPDQVVRIHASGEYLVYMIGFMPGFAYLGGLDARIVTPRRRSPRTAVPASTVGIGGNQTGVYPLESPGGWNLIGRTPLAVFDAARPQPTLLAAGDRVRFRPITRNQFHDWPA